MNVQGRRLSWHQNDTALHSSAVILIDAEHFYDGGKKDQLHKSKQTAIKAAWSFAKECIDSDIDEDEFREKLIDSGAWGHECDEGEDLVIKLRIVNIKPPSQ